LTSTRLSAADRCTQLLEVAADIVAAQGLQGFTMEAVAAKSGVTRPILYRHFADADALVAALFASEVTGLRQAIEQELTGRVGLEERLGAILSAWLDTLERRGTLVSALLFDQLPNAALDELRAKQRAASHRLVAAEIRSALSVTPTVAMFGASVVLNATQGLVLQVSKRSMSRRRAEQLFLSMMIGALNQLAQTGR
jgi:AcrR family transcriptional regulator